MINSYYSSYSLEYYEVGAVYSFYMRKGDKYATVADDSFVKKYAKNLDKLEKDTEQYPALGKFAILNRACGVVVEKVQGDKGGSKDKIRVMFKLIEEDGSVSYGTKLYVVNYSGVETDGWEALPVQTELKNGSFYVGDNQAVTVKGGSGRVTSDDGDTKGRVTADDGSSKSKSSASSKTTEKRSGSTAGVTVDDVTGVTLDED